MIVRVESAVEGSLRTWTVLPLPSPVQTPQPLKPSCVRRRRRFAPSDSSADAWVESGATFFVYAGRWPGQSEGAFLVLRVPESVVEAARAVRLIDHAVLDLLPQSTHAKPSQPPLEHPLEIPE